VFHEIVDGPFRGFLHICMDLCTMLDGMTGSRSPLELG
jgi:hypothetical protein